ncbi:MAG: hypothetical protein AAF298_00235 [Cyanobacteria bacterium P01_A01_bin.40]
MTDLKQLIRKSKQFVAAEHNLHLTELRGSGMIEGDRAIVTIRNFKTQKVYKFTYPI